MAPLAGSGVIARPHGIALAALLGAASVAGAYATITTAKLGDSETKPEVVASAEIAKRRCPPGRVGGIPAKGPRGEAAEASRDPALRPCRPREHPVVRRTAGTRHRTHDDNDDHDDRDGTRASEPTDANDTRFPLADTHQAGREGIRRTAPAATRDDPATPEPVAQAPATTTAAPVTAPPPPAAAPAPAPAPPTTTAPAPQSAPTTLSKSEAEKQCEALKRAAEGQGEAAKKDAERRCEELKKAAEGDD